MIRQPKHTVNAPENAIRVGGHAALLTRVVRVGEEVVLVRGREHRLALREPDERVPRPSLACQLI